VCRHAHPHLLCVYAARTEVRHRVDMSSILVQALDAQSQPLEVIRATHAEANFWPVFASITTGSIGAPEKTCQTSTPVAGCVIRVIRGRSPIDMALDKASVQARPRT
jgi:hypothetical protein